MEETLNASLIQLENDLKELQKATSLIKSMQQNADFTIESSREIIKAIQNKTQKLDEKIGAHIEKLNESSFEILAKYEGLYESKNDSVVKLYNDYRELGKTVYEFIEFLNKIKLPQTIKSIHEQVDKLQEELNRSISERKKFEGNINQKLFYVFIGLSIIGLLCLLNLFFP